MRSRLPAVLVAVLCGAGLFQANPVSAAAPACGTASYASCPARSATGGSVAVRPNLNQVTSLTPVKANSATLPSAATPAPTPTAAPAPATATISDAAVCATVLPGYASCMARVERSGSAVLRPNLSQAASLSPAQVQAHVGGLTPASLRAAYGLTANNGGGGVTVGIIDAYDDPTIDSDLSTYRTQFGLAPCTIANGCFQKLNQSGGTTYPAVNSGWSSEMALDVEMISAVCPLCHIVLVEARSNSDIDLVSSVQTAINAHATVVSMSFGGGEWSGESAADIYLNHPGIAITASAGDSGYGASYPAASPYVTAVGGTTLRADTSTRGWHETAWSGTGSGCSRYESKPSWQTDTGCARRTISDVAAVASPSTGVAVYDETGVGGWAVFGGTSVAAPVVAATYALNGGQPAHTTGAGPLYAHPTTLNDVTSGSNGNCSAFYLCNAGLGYDGPTGLGTPTGIFGTAAASGLTMRASTTSCRSFFPAMRVANGRSACMF